LPKLGQPRFHFASIDTTMREAARRAAEGAPEGTLVSADEQTAGRGRFGRIWRSEPGVGLYFSLVLRPRVAPADSAALTLACGLGVARGVGDAAGVVCDIRWPNDVMLRDRKLAGILVEMNAEGDRLRYVIAGVGINVNQETVPEELAETATSLRIETGCEYLRDAVLDAVLRRMDDYYRMFVERGPAPVIDAFTRASSYAKGKRVVIEGAGRPLEGVTAGLDSRGQLLLRTTEGKIEPVVAGSVRPVSRSAPRQVADP
jgi:BirA family biotin operon repressor/biotin-[acetyl-CoA-carboxylase] ligase